MSRVLSKRQHPLLPSSPASHPSNTQIIDLTAVGTTKLARRNEFSINISYTDQIFALEQATKTQRGSRDIALLFL
jgi:hypothetical protein